MHLGFFFEILVDGPFQQGQDLIHGLAGELGACGGRVAAALLLAGEGGHAVIAGLVG